MSRAPSQLRAVPATETPAALSAGPPRDVRHALLEDIARLIARARQLELKDSAFLLEIAHLDLKTKIYKISDDELHALTMAARTGGKR